MEPAVDSEKAGSAMRGAFSVVIAARSETGSRQLREIVAESGAGYRGDHGGNAVVGRWRRPLFGGNKPGRCNSGPSANNVQQPDKPVSNPVSGHHSMAGLSSALGLPRITRPRFAAGLQAIPPLPPFSRSRRCQPATYPRPAEGHITRSEFDRASNTRHSANSPRRRGRL